VAATLEVLDIAGRPAVLQEWLTGLPGSEWPALAAVPGVWFRLLSQAALALRAAHAAGLPHGHLEAASLVCTGEGTLKLCGLGEPDWLAGSAALEGEPSVASDLRALGGVAAGWLALAAGGKSGKVKPLPDELLAVLQGLREETDGPRYLDAAALLEDLERAGAHVPANAAAWERFLRQVREQSTDAALRRSA
jgi:hypothetical protein